MKWLLLLIFLLTLPLANALSDFVFVDGELVQQAEVSILVDVGPVVDILKGYGFVAGDLEKTSSTNIGAPYLGDKCAIAFNKDGKIVEIANCRATKAIDVSGFLDEPSGHLQLGKDCDISLNDLFLVSAKEQAELRKTSLCTVKLLSDSYSGFSSAKLKRGDGEIKSGGFTFTKDGQLIKATLFMTETKNVIFGDEKYAVARNTLMLFNEGEIEFDFSYNPSAFELFGSDGKKTVSFGKVKPKGAVVVHKEIDGYVLEGDFELVAGDKRVFTEGKLKYNGMEFIAGEHTKLIVYQSGKGGVRVLSGLDPVKVSVCSSELGFNHVDFCKTKEEVLRANGKGFLVSEVETIVDKKGDISSVGLSYGVNARLLCAYNNLPDCKAKETTPIIVPGIGFSVGDGHIEVRRNGGGEPNIILDGNVGFAHALYTLALAKEKLYSVTGETTYLPVRDAKVVFTGAGVSGIVDDGITCIGSKVEKTCGEGSVIIKPGKDATKVYTAAGDFGWPVSIVGMNYVSQCVHNGNDIDLALPEGSPLYALDNGVVTKACTGDKKNCYCKGEGCAGCGKCGPNGNHVVVEIPIDAGHRIASRYIHMKSVQVREGQRVVKGQLLGLSGNTGFSAGPHLHWRLGATDYGGESTNPLCLYDDQFLENILYKGGSALACKKLSTCGSITPTMKKINFV